MRTRILINVAVLALGLWACQKSHVAHTESSADDGPLPDYLLHEGDLNQRPLVAPLAGATDLVNIVSIAADDVADGSAYTDHSDAPQPVNDDVNTPLPEPAHPARLSVASIDKGLLKICADTLNKAFSQPSLQPGRHFSFAIAESRFVNAWDNGNQIFTINRPTLALPGKQLLAIICHETAHSAQNHVAQFHTYMSLYSRARRAWREDAAAFETFASIVSSPGRPDNVWTWNSSAYASLEAVQKRNQPSHGDKMKRLESEADVIGGMICGELGMSPDEYLENSRNNLATLHNITANSAVFQKNGYPVDGSGPILKAMFHDAANESTYPELDGASISLPEIDGDIFLADDNHPSADERLAQLERMHDIIAQHYHAEATDAAEFAQAYDQYFAAHKAELMVNIHDQKLKPEAPRR